MDLTGDPDCVSEEGCPYCSLLLQGLLRLDPEVETRLGYDAKIRFKQRRDMVVYRDPNGSRGQQPSLKNVELQYEFYKEGCNRAYKPVGNTSSDTSYWRMHWWVQTCLTDHALCGMGEPTSLPTRLLHLGDDLADDTPNIKLIEPSTELRERYVALSHSWGKEQPLRTTTATLEDHKAGIPFARLPKTFQDAVSITRRLGIRHLWIDSLCIIQDSSDDWQIEASRMASVYRNSWLTVSGTASSSPSSGCYRHGQAVDVQLPDDDVITNTTNNNRAAAVRARAVRTERLAAERAPADAAAVATAAADAAAAAAAADAARIEVKRVKREQATAAAEEPRAPETPARPPRSRFARGERRAVPYLGCLRSALAGRSTGKCFDAADIDRLRASICVLLEEEGGGEEEQVAPIGNPAAVRA
ncbi:hypothetical protein DL768_008709 [Monosporascus sp. mg162]|nr:hypothetical protein DL768_008709 [Monosporascus sp. mg162]